MTKINWFVCRNEPDRGKRYLVMVRGGLSFSFSSLEGLSE